MAEDGNRPTKLGKQTDCSPEEGGDIGAAVKGEQTADLGSNSKAAEEGAMVAARVNPLREPDDEYQLDESIWDCVVFIGLFGRWQPSVLIVLLAILNLTVQISFIVLTITAMSGMTDQDSDGSIDFHVVPDDDIRGFYTWRLTVAHSARWFDPSTETSLARRVCNGYAGTVASANQERIYSEMTTYLPEDVKESIILKGPGLLLLSMGLWGCYMLKDCAGVYGFYRMHLALRARSHSEAITQIDWAEDDDSVLEFTSLSHRRFFASMLLVVLPRMLIVVTLGITGALYLMKTTAVEDLILNAIALAFILEIDELTFAFAPPCARALIQKMKPINLLRESKIMSFREIASGSWKHPRAVSTKLLHLSAYANRSVIAIILLAIFVAGFWLVFMNYEYTRLKHAQAALCAGDLDFIIESNPLSGMQLVATTQATGDDWKFDYASRLETDAVLQRSALCDNEDFTSEALDARSSLGSLADVCVRLRGLSARMPSHDAHQALSQAASRVDTLDALAWTRSDAWNNATCVDSLQDLQARAALVSDAVLVQALGLKGYPETEEISCMKMAKHCKSDNATVEERVRLYCPETCKCHCATHRSCGGYLWPFNRATCPPSCQALVNAEVKDLARLSEVECEEIEHNSSVNQVPDLFMIELTEYLAETAQQLDENMRLDNETLANFQLRALADYPEWASCSLDTVNIHAWAHEAPDFCDIIPIVFYIFRLDLCGTAAGNWDVLTTSTLAGRCPQRCGLCPAPTTASISYNGKDFWQQDFGWFATMPPHKYKHFPGISCATGYDCFHLMMFDRTGDGWDGAAFRLIQNTEPSGIVFESSVPASSSSTDLTSFNKSETFCLPYNDTLCYSISVSADNQFEEVSWELSLIDGGYLLGGSDNEVYEGGCGHWVSRVRFQCRAWSPVRARRKGPSGESIDSPGVLLAANDEAGLATVAWNEDLVNASGGWLHTPYYEDVPMSSVRLGKQDCHWDENLLAGHNAFEIAGLDQASAENRELEVCPGLRCSLVINEWAMGCTTPYKVLSTFYPTVGRCPQANSSGYVVFAGKNGTTTLSDDVPLGELCPLQCAVPQEENDCACQSAIEYWCLNAGEQGFSRKLDSALTSNCYYWDDFGEDVTFCPPYSGCSHDPPFMMESLSLQHVTPEKCELIEQAQPAEQVCLRRRFGVQREAEEFIPTACPKHCTDIASYDEIASNKLSARQRNESCNEFFAYFGGAPAPEAGQEFCNTMKQNRGCNCEECELCDWRGSYPGYPWLVVEGLCIVHADFCLSSPAVTNAPDQFCRILVNDEAFGDPLVVSQFHTQEYWDYLEINHVRYSGKYGPKNVVPTGEIIWSTNKHTWSPGWRLCPPPDMPLPNDLFHAVERL